MDQLFVDPECFLLAFFEGAEEDATGLTARIQTAVDAHSVQLLEAAAVELQHLEARRDVPDVDESDVSELHAPLGSDTDATAESVDHVAQVLAAVVALVGAGPHAVHGPDPFRFCQHIFEGDLQVVVDVVRVAVDQINLSHSGI